MNTHPFHDGELEVQSLTGNQDTTTRMAGFVKSTILPGALAFISQQSVIWIGVKDKHSNHLAFPLFGSPGFINPNEGELIDINLEKICSLPREWFDCFIKDTFIGCIVVEFESRRRIRINGVIKKINKQQLQIQVRQSFPNCPKYIRRRKIVEAHDFAQLNFESKGTELNRKLEALIQQSDTAFVTSSGPNGIDVSHRGGDAGFIKTETQNKIIIPDYQGNNMFSTLGNFKKNPFGGLVIIDFEQGNLLQITGEISFFINHENSELNTGGTKRFWELKIDQWQLFKVENFFKWESYDFSPFNP